MRELNWKEHEVVECLGVLGHFDEDSGVYEFRLERDGLVLDLGICTHESHIDISLLQLSNSEPIFETGFVVLDRIGLVNEPRVSYLEFSDCVIAPLYADIDDLDFLTTSGLKLPIFQVHMFPKFKLLFV